MKTNVNVLLTPRAIALATFTCFLLWPPSAFSASGARDVGQAASQKLRQSADRLAATGSTAPTPLPPKLPPQLSAEPATVGPGMNLTVGKSTVLRVPHPIDRISIGNPAVADVTPISQREVYLLGKDLGTTNIIIWSKDAQATVIDVIVTTDPMLLETELKALLPDEPDIRVKTSADSIVLQGTVSDSVKAARAVEIAQAWVRRLTRGIVLPVAVGDPGKGGTTIQVGETRNVQQAAQVAGPQVINMLKVRAPMQVMLEVKVAEIAKTLLNKLGITTRLNHRSGDFTYDILAQSSFFNQLLGAAAITKGSLDFVQLDAARDDGLIRTLAEPNIMAISGQEASFRAGGKIFIPVARQNNLTGGTTITLEEKEFGVGVKFKPTVLDNNRIHLRVAPEVSELQQSGTPFTTVGGATSVLPSFTLRRAETTVQLNDGQSFMIAGLIKSDVVQTVNRFPGLGDIPILGALFRSTEFQRDNTELMFVITPRLVKPLPANYALPTDGFIEPTYGELFLHGQMEGARPGANEKTRAPSGRFEMK